MLAEWLVGFDGMGGVLSGYKGAGNYGGVWTIVVFAVMSSIILYAVATIVEAAVLTAWGPDAGKLLTLAMSVLDRGDGRQWPELSVIRATMGG